MSDEQLVITLTEITPATTSTGKHLHRAHDGQHYPSGYPCWSIWDADVAATLTALVGQPVTVRVNRDKADFPAIKKFVKAGGAEASAPAATTPSPAAASPQSGGGSGTTALAAPGSGNTMKRDPLGVMLNLRQTALNCATTWMVSHNEKLPGEEKLGTAHLMKCADLLFRHLVRGVEDALPIPQTGPQTQDNGPAGVPDDDIPFHHLPDMGTSFGGEHWHH